MGEFYQVYLVERTYGIGHFLSSGIFMLACALTFRPRLKKAADWLKVLRDFVILYAAWLGLCSVMYLVIQSWFMLIVEAMLLAVYAPLVSRGHTVERTVQQVVFLTCFVLMLRISENVGNYTDKLGLKWHGVSMTDVTLLAAMVLIAVYLRHFKADKEQLLPQTYPVLMIAISILAVSTQLYSMIRVDPTELKDLAVRGYNLYLAASFLIIILLGYYLYYAIGQEHTEKIMLLAQQRRLELDQENMIAAQKTYDALREVRHEIKNHTAYMKTLLDAGDYDGLHRYFDSYQTRTSELVHYVSSGNRTVDAVVNSYISRAKLYDIQLKTILAVPAQLPYQDEDVCSLLANLLDNAIEASAESDAEQKVITLSIRPQMDYYMIRVENPVDVRKVTPRRRLTLQTTKENPELHGYGTRIIRRIAENYGGTVKFSINEETFVADVMLENPQEQGGGRTDGKTAHRSV